MHMYGHIVCDWTLNAPKIRTLQKNPRRRKSNSNLLINSKNPPKSFELVLVGMALSLALRSCRKWCLQFHCLLRSQSLAHRAFQLQPSTRFIRCEIMTNIKHVLPAPLLETSAFGGVSLKILLVLLHRRIVRPSRSAAWRMHIYTFSLTYLTYLPTSPSHSVTSPKWSNPTTLRSPEELSLARILGHIRIKSQKEFWEITTNMKIRRKLKKLVSRCPTSQSRIDSDYDSAESIADSDLEEGELRKNVALTTVCTWARRKLWFLSKTHSFRETRSRSNTEERCECTTYSSWSLKKRELEVKFISRATSVWETGCSVFIRERRTGKPVREFYLKYADPSKLGRPLLEGNKDHLLSQARSELTMQEHQVGSFKSCINELQQQGCAQGLEFQNTIMDILNLEENKLVDKKNHLWRKKLLRDTQIRNIHELAEIKKAQELRVGEFSVQKKKWHETIQKLTSMNDSGEFRGNQITVGDFLTFPVNQQRFQVLLPCWAAHKLLPLDTWNSLNVFWKSMPTFAGAPSTMSSIPVEISAEFHGWTARQQISDLQYSVLHIHFYVGRWRFKNHVTTCSDFPSEAMLWINEMEMVDSVDKFKSSRSVSWNNFRISRCWTRRLPLLWTRSSEIPTSRRRSVSRNRKPRGRTGFFVEDRSLTWSTTTFESLALMIPY